MTPVPTMIRGVTYPSMTAAARALGVHLSTVHAAVDRGTADRIGLVGGRGGPAGQPVTLNGQRFPSMAAAARALGVRWSSVKKAVDAGRHTIRPRARA